MPIYEYQCEECRRLTGEKIVQINSEPPMCCGKPMARIYSGSVAIRDSRSITGKRNELWINRLDDIHKAQEQRGERLTLPHPSKVLT